VCGCTSPTIRFLAGELTVLFYEDDARNIAGRNEEATVKTSTVTERVTLTDQDRDEAREYLTGQDIREAFESIAETHDGVAFISRLVFDQTEVLLSLKEFEGYVDSQDTTYFRPATFGGEPINHEGLDFPFVPLISMEIDHSLRMPARSDDETGTSYRFKLRSGTDIWMQPTEIGATNRKRLADVLSCLHERLPDGDRLFTGDHYVGGLTLTQTMEMPSLVPWHDEDE